MKTLVLYANYSSTSSYYDDWNDAFINDNDLDCDSIDICTVNLSKLSKNIKLYDFIVMLHSTNADSLSYSIKILNILNERKGKLAVFAGNEVNIPSAPVLKRISFFEKLNPDYIFTQLFEDTGRWLYSSCTNSKVVSVPHALNTKVFKSKIELKNRKIDIGVRSYKYDVHLGDNDRNNFFTKVEKKLKNIKLVSDISFDPNKRFTRDEWAKFLQNSKATIATEAGSYYLEKNDNFINLIQEYLSLHRSNNSGITIKDKSRIRRGIFLEILSSTPPPNPI